MFCVASRGDTQGRKRDRGGKLSFSFLLGALSEKEELESESAHMTRQQGGLYQVPRATVDQNWEDDCDGRAEEKRNAEISQGRHL